VGTVWARIARHTVTVPATWNEDRIAIDVYRRAQQTGEPITLGTVERHIDELLSRPPDCPCGLCTAAAAVRDWGVWLVIRRWQSGVAATRRRSAR
jgi:hypothetical protein